MAGIALIAASASSAVLAGLLVVSGTGGHVQSAALGAELERCVASAREAIRGIPAVRQARERERLARRRSACLREMPTLIDVLTLGLSAGLSFDASLSLYCDRYQTELSQAFSEAMLSWRMGVTSREEALEAMACELGVDALARFATVVGESLDFGSPLASALEVQAKAIRDEQRAQVEEEIEKAPVKMLVPLGVLVVPAMLLAILGPLLASAASFGR
ncbi:type II secretion system F family protein [Olsenella sp. AF16-14LB]|jgi:tight adherence protein C|uniref:type II secretion system F family protein n=1 Tax=unclassified Olsenella TaxID=2638792 RepID=UPI000509EFAE|nr:MULTISPECIES: type II secretion system F family protein [unclassified Olsenella]RGJ46747.1 type II secretion system F family protein [Olsenella sp. TM06-36]RGU52479.1 type II secretion system F family protein [Olsenella sp. AF16-14LB]RGU83721.1 type II secretion system F family protein [Olsenella sp. AF15-43LB]RHD74792.1 type II secretion system F family protein [Olsenella sp. AM30-3LB]